MKKTVSFFLYIFLISFTVFDVRYVKPLFSFVLVDLHSFVPRAWSSVSVLYCFAGPIIKNLVTHIYCNLFQALGCLVRAEGKTERGLDLSSAIN